MDFDNIGDIINVNALIYKELFNNKTYYILEYIFRKNIYRRNVRGNVGLELAIQGFAHLGKVYRGGIKKTFRAVILNFIGTFFTINLRKEGKI